MKWTPALILSDVDGTLLDDQDYLSPRTCNAIRNAVDDGVHFILATGRPPRWIQPVVEALGFAPLTVCANGAVLYDPQNDQILATQVLSPTLLHQLVTTIVDIIPGVGLAVERIGSCARDVLTPQFVSAPGYEHAWLNPDNVEVTTEDLVTQPAVKLLVRKVGSSSAQLAAQLAPQLDDTVELTYSTNNGLVEVVLSGVTKATGIATLIESLGVTFDRSIAFGDMPNDIPMLINAGLGIAMGNAHKDVIAIADEVTATNSQDGVALVLERWWC